MIIAGERPDRHAASFWRHFFHAEHSAEGTTDAMLAFQKEFDWDFMKINPRADFHLEDWGLQSNWSHNEFRKHDKVNFPIKTVDDWSEITANSPSAPALAEHLKVVSSIRKKSDRELPIMMTLFSPLAIAGRMIEDKSAFVDHIRNSPEKVHKALRAITDTYVAYASELRNAGADGLFFATLQWASSDMLSWEEYQQFGVPYDLEVVAAAESDAINILHVCGGNNYLRELAKIDSYNAAIYNWDSSDETNLSLEEAETALDNGVMLGGIEQERWLRQSSPDEIARRMDELRDRYQSTRLIIGPGCVVPPEVPRENLYAIRKALR